MADPLVQFATQTRTGLFRLFFRYWRFVLVALALMGWIFDIEVLKRIHPSLVTMKANTAVCLMLVASPFSYYRT